MIIISGPCVIESESLVMKVAEYMASISSVNNVEFYFKSSFDKANRSSSSSFRGPGMYEGLRILERVRNEFGFKILTDVHEDTAIDEVASVVDVMQTPAFLVRQTNFIQKVASFGITVNIKKGQFQSPWDMQNVVDKCNDVGNSDIWLCDRGTCFGYNNLVSDMRGLSVMKRTNRKVIYDATHSVQQPGGLGSVSGGQREFVPVLSRAAVAAGVDGVFLETHPNPDAALSDGPNMIPLKNMDCLIRSLVSIHDLTNTLPHLEDELI